MPNQNHVYWAEVSPDGLSYTLAGRTRGPFRDELEREHDLLAVLRAWRARAEALGGSVLRRTHAEIVVVLPEGVAVEGSVPQEAVRGTTPTEWPRKS